MPIITILDKKYLQIGFNFSKFISTGVLWEQQECFLLEDVFNSLKSLF